MATLVGYPSAVFAFVAAVLLGTIAWISATDMQFSPASTDIWQHAASLLALMDNLRDPANPFVVSDETSRHFHPLWVGAAALGLAFGLTVWQVLTLVSYLSMALLGAGIYAFARAFYTSPWGPLALLCVMLFGWSVRIHHTGFHSVNTLLYGAAYPATILVGLTLILWSLTIAALRRPAFVWAIIPLAALMFATHQLGAVIGFIGALCFTLFWPDVPTRVRALVCISGIAGAGMSLLWPYYNPITLMLQPGNSTWIGGPDFYDWVYLVGVFAPSALGLFGLLNKKALPLAIALLIFLALYLLGLTGAQAATRFLMPAVLVLHIGLAGALLQAMANQPFSTPRKYAVAGGGIAVVALSFVSAISHSDTAKFDPSAIDVAPFEAASILTADIPDTREVAALDTDAWPIVATGQRVLSVPWPEPGIHDLAARQDGTRQLFDARLSRADRLALADSLDVQTLLVDERWLDANTKAVLRSQSTRTSRAGTFLRFDLLE